MACVAVGESIFEDIANHSAKQYGVGSSVAVRRSIDSESDVVIFG